MLQNKKVYFLALPLLRNGMQDFKFIGFYIVSLIKTDKDIKKGGWVSNYRLVHGDFDLLLLFLFSL